MATRSKEMGMGMMIVLLVVIVAFLPLVVRLLTQSVSGFQDVNNPPAVGTSAKLPTWRPDQNTDYICRSPNEDGVPCPEGTFCDGTRQVCEQKYVGATGPITGYYS